MTHESITSNIVGLWNKMGQVSESVHKIGESVQELATIIRQGAPQPMGQPGPACCHQCSGSTMSSAQSMQPSSPSATPGAIAVVPPWPQPSYPGGGPMVSSVPVPRPVPAIIVPGPTTATCHASASTTGQTASSRCPPTARQPPQAGLGIPNLPLKLSDGTRHHKSQSWRDIVTHWLTGDPERDLNVPLKDWPPAWYQGHNRPLAAKYGQRLTIALEFIEV